MAAAVQGFLSSALRQRNVTAFTGDQRTSLFLRSMKSLTPQSISIQLQRAMDHCHIIISRDLTFPATKEDFALPG